MDGCLYAVKCSRRRFKGETDRQNMLMEVYALAAVCDSAQETINIVRYHQVCLVFSARNATYVYATLHMAVNRIGCKGRHVGMCLRSW